MQPEMHWIKRLTRGWQHFNAAGMLQRLPYCRFLCGFICRKRCGVGAQRLRGFEQTAIARLHAWEALKQAQCGLLILRKPIWRALSFRRQCGQP